MSATAPSFDVLVVGCGIAGLAAAMAARQQGASVAILERAPVEERGGNTRHTGAWMRMKNEAEVSDDFEEHFAANAGGYIDPALLIRAVEPPEMQPSILRSMSYPDPNVIETFAREAPPTMAWLKTFGVRFIPLDTPFPTSVQPRIQPSGGGLALIEALAPCFEKDGGKIFYEVTAQRLVQNERGEVIGIRGVGRGNRPLEFGAGAVILGCGGFEGNPEMMTHYIGQRAVYLRAMSTGCHYNKGEGIRMALEIGAAPCGDYGLWHASPLDPCSNRNGATMQPGKDIGYPYIQHLHSLQFLEGVMQAEKDGYDGYLLSTLPDLYLQLAQSLADIPAVEAFTRVVRELIAEGVDAVIPGEVPLNLLLQRGRLLRAARRGFRETLRRVRRLGPALRLPRCLAKALGGHAKKREGHRDFAFPAAVGARRGGHGSRHGETEKIHARRRCATHHVPDARVLGRGR